jgi:pimeloyl-ACP methyl ester carboxylesterase
MSTQIFRSADGARAVRARTLEVLERWPVPSRRLRVPTREGDTFVVASGRDDAPAVIAMQGSGASSAMWMRQVAAWAPHLRLFAVDVIGEPGLSAPSRPPLGSKAYARWLDDVMDGLGLARAAMLGVSLGGWLAIDYATRRPTRVSKVALLCPGGIGRRKMGVMVTAALLRPFGAWGRRETFFRALGPVARAAGRTPTSTDLALRDLSSLVFRHFRPRRDMPIFDDAVLQYLTMPVLAVVGGRDAMIDSHETAARLRAAAPHATIRVLPDVGHLLPDQSAALLDFLREEPAHA